MRNVTVSVTTEFDISVDEGISLDEVQDFALETLVEDIKFGFIQGIEVDILEDKSE